MTNVLYTAEETLRVNKCTNTERGPNVNSNVDKLCGETFILIRPMTNINQNLDSRRTISTSP